MLDKSRLEDRSEMLDPSLRWDDGDGVRTFGLRLRPLFDVFDQAHSQRRIVFVEVMATR